MTAKYPLFIVLILVAVPCMAQWSIDVEGDYVFSIPYNTVRIPSQGGTELDIANDLDTKTTYTFRVRANYTINDRHITSALVAPLSIESHGVVNKDVVYSGKIFQAGLPINTKYKFNSYRLTYRYMFVNKQDFKFGAGLTGKIREANITLSNENGSADFPDLGFVPLVNFYLQYLPSEKWSLLLEGDALGTKQGRAEDIFAGVTYNLFEGIDLKGGYRILEGGADVTDNYNFSFINYAAVGIIVKPK